MTSNRLRVVGTSLFLLASLLGAMPAVAGMRLATGSYVGNGAATQSVTDLPFRPDLVMVKAETSEFPVMRSSTMIGDLSKDLGDNKALQTQRVVSLDATGFTVGNDNTVNQAGTTYHWTAWEAAAGEMVLGKYTGNKVDGRTITGLGFTPAYVIVLGDVGEHATQRFLSQDFDESLEFRNNSVRVDRLEWFFSGGFQLGTHNSVNDGSEEFHYIAWAAGSTVDQDSYLGNSTPGRGLTTAFDAEMVLIKSEENPSGVHRPATLTGDATLPTNDEPLAAGMITALEAGRFVTGSNQTVNRSGDVYHWVAFRDDPLSVTNPDLAISKTVNNANPAVGDTVTYTVTATNTGPGEFSWLSIYDKLPSGLTYLSNTRNRGVYDTFFKVWTIAPLAADSTAVLNIKARVEPGAEGLSPVNKAVLTFANPTDSNSANNADSVAVTVATAPAAADLVVTKAVDRPRPNVGEAVQYTIDVFNAGPDDAGGVAVVDSLATGIVYTSDSPSTGSYDPGTGIWTVGTILAGETATLSLDTTVGAGAEGSTITNSANVIAVDQDDPDTTNNRDSVGITVPVIDLQLGQTVDLGAPPEGSNVAFTISLINAGPDTATGVVIRDLLPAGLSYQAATPAQGTYLPASGDWTVGTLPPSASTSMDIVGSVDMGTGGSTLTNGVSVLSVDQVDSQVMNDTASVSVTIPAADLTITKTVDNANPGVGDPIEFTVTVSNQSSFPVTGVEVIDIRPLGLGFLATTPSQGSYVQGSGTWTVGTLGSGTSATLIIPAVPQSGTEGLVITNVASISAVDQTELNLSDNADSASVTVTGVDLAIDKTVDTASPNEGDTVVYTVTLTNAGPDSATGVAVTDVLPTGITYVSDSPSQGSYVPGTGIWTVGSLGDGEVVTLTLSATVDAGTAGSTITNTATVSAVDQVDSDTANNTSSAAIGAQSANLGLSKTVNNDNPNVGDAVVFTLVLTNDGPNQATTISVTDALPAGLTLVSASADLGSYVNGTGVWSIAALPASNVATLTLTATVNAGTGGNTIVNTAAVSASDQADPFGGNNSDTASLTVQRSDLSISKVVDDSTPEVGATVVFTLTVSNAGPSAATGVVVSDPLPAGLTYVSSSPSTGSYDSGSGVWTLGSVSSGSSASLQISATVSAAAASGSVTNTATIIASDQEDPDLADRTSMATVGAALTVTASVFPQTSALLHPGAGTVEALRFRLTNSASVAVTLNSITIRNRTAGSGTQAQLDAAWTPLGLILDPDGARTSLGTGVMTGGARAFSGLSVTVPAAGAVDFAVDAGASLVARDGDALDLHLVSTGDIAFDSAVTVSGSFPLDPAGSYTVDGMTAAQIVVRDLPVTSALPGETGVVVFDCTVPRNGYADDTLQQFRLANRGTASPSDLSALRLWRDGGNGVFDGSAGGDVLLGTMTWTGSVWSRSGLSTPVGAAGARLFAVGDVAVSATEGATLWLTLPTMPAVGVLMASSNDGPIDMEMAPSSGVTLLSDPGAVVTVRGESIPGGSLTPGGATAEILRVVIANHTPVDHTLTGIRFENASFGPGSTTQLDASWATLNLVATGSGGTPPQGTTFGSTLPSGGVVAFDGIGVIVGAGDSITVSVMGAASLNARDGDSLDLISPEAAALTFLGVPPIQGAFPIDPAGSHFVDGMVAAQMRLHPVVSGNVDPGTTDQLVLDVTIPANGYDTDQLQGLRLTQLGDAIPGTDIAGIALWRDGGNGEFDGGAGDDVSLGDTSWDGTRWSLSGLNASVPPVGLRVFAVADIATTATPGRSVHLGLGADIIPAVSMVSGNDGPIDVAVANPNALTINARPLSVVRFTEQSSSEWTVLPGSTPVEVMRFTVSNEGAEPETLTTVTLADASVGPGTTTQLTRNWSTLTLRDEQSGNAMDTAVMSGGAAAFSGFSLAIPGGGSANLSVTAGASLSARDSDLLDLRLTGAESSEFTRDVDAQGAWPLDPVGHLVVDGMAAAQASLVNLSDADVFAGETRRLAFHVIVPANGYEADELQGLRLANLGTAQPVDDIAAMDLWRDGGDGAFDAGIGDDVRLGGFAWDGSAWSVTGISSTIPITACRVFVSVDIDSRATEGRTVRLSLPLGALPAIQVASDNDGPRDAAVSNGGTLTILESILGVVTVSADVQTIQSVLPGGAFREALRVRLVNFTGEPQTLTALTLTNAASGPGTAADLDRDWSNLQLKSVSGGTGADLLLATGAMSSGAVHFGSLGISLPVNQAIELRVDAGASLLARDSDLLDLQVMGAEALSFTGSPELFAGWPLDPSGHLVVDGMAAAQVTLRSVPEGTFAGGSIRNPAFSATIPANGYQADVLNRLNLVNLGNARAGVDLQAVELWIDDGDAVFEAQSDRNAGQLTYTGDRWEITALNEPIPQTGLPVFVTVNVSESAQDGRTVQLGLPSEPDVALGVASGNDGPRDRAVLNPFTQVITSVDRVTLSAVAISSGTTRPGAHNLPLEHLVATNTYADARTLTEITFSNLTSGSGSRAQLDDEVEVLVLRADGDGDGQLDTDGVDPVIATTSFSQGQAVFRDISWTIEAGQSRHLFLTGEVSLRESTDGDVLAARITDVLSVAFAEPTSVAAEWPVDSGARWVVNGMVAAQFVNFGGPNLTIGAGSGPVVGLDLQLPPNGYLDDVLERLDVVNLGSAGPAEVTGLEVWADGGNGRFDADEGDDSLLGALSWIGDRWRSDPLDLHVPSSGARVFVAFDVAPSLTDSASVRLAVPVDGVTVASLNDGPLDIAVAYPEAMILSSAPLLATLRTQPTVTTVGQEISLTMTVTNNASETVTGILAGLPVTSGSASVSLAGAAPSAPLTLRPGESGSLQWTYVATTTGQVRFQGGVEGTFPDDAPGRSLPASSNLHTVVLEASSMDLFALEARASSVNRGQSGVVPLTLTFRNPGEADRGAAINVNGLTVRFEDENGADVLPGDLLKGMVLKEGNRVFASLSEADLDAAEAQVALTFSSPMLVTTLEPATLSLQLDIEADTVVPTFRTVILDGGWVRATDAVSGAPVVVVLQEGSYPIRSGVMNLVSESFGVDVTAAEAPVVRSSPGVRDLEFMRLDLESVGIDGISSEVRAGGFSVMLVDEAGNAISNPAAFVENLRVVSPFNTLLNTPLAPAGPEVLNLRFTNLLTLPVNTPVGLRVEGNLRSNAPLQAFRVRLAAPEGFDLRDANTRSVVAARYVDSPVEGPLVRVERPAEVAVLSGIPGFPDHAAVGEQDLGAMTVLVHHPGGAGVGRVRLDGFALQCRNDDRSLLAPALFLDELRVLRDGAPVVTVQNLPGLPEVIQVPLPGVMLEPGEVAEFEIHVDIEATAPGSFLEITLTGPGTTIVDANTGVAVLISPAEGAELPIFSGLMRLQPPARELAVGLEDRMPTALVADGRERTVGVLALDNPAAKGTGRIRIDRVRTRGGDAARTPVAMGSVASQVRFLLDGIEVGHSGPLTADSIDVWVEFPDGVYVYPGEALALEVQLVLNQEIDVETFRVGWDRDDIGVAQPEGALLAVEIRPAEGRTFPLWTEPGSFNAADLTESYSNFPNPFNAGREPTTFVYYLPRDGSVTLRLWTPRGEEVLTLLDGVSKTAGLHQNDVWDGRNGNGTLVTNGVFLAELSIRFDDGTVERLLRKVAVMR